MRRRAGSLKRSQMNSTRRRRMMTFKADKGAGKIGLSFAAPPPTRTQKRVAVVAVLLRRAIMSTTSTAAPLRLSLVRENVEIQIEIQTQELRDLAETLMTFGGATPDEVYFERHPANRDPRFEPRPGWPRASPCAKPRTLVKGQPGVRLTISVEHVAGHRHLPIVRLNRAS